jgi:hypothetical protein
LCGDTVFEDSFDKNFFIILADWKATVNQQPLNPDFDQIIVVLRARSFDVAESAEVADGVLVSKYGAGAVLAASGKLGAPVAFAVTPGALIGGRVARLLDRGYQKFLKTTEFELPATASQLEAIHRFSEELKLLTGAVDFYNEALGTTSDLYEYDRLKGREEAQSAEHRP